MANITFFLSILVGLDTKASMMKYTIVVHVKKGYLHTTTSVTSPKNVFIPLYGS